MHRDLGDTTVAWIEVAALVLEGRGQILNKYQRGLHLLVERLAHTGVRGLEMQA